MGIEELTKEELVEWIRFNVSGIDEHEVVVQTLWRRDDLARKNAQEANERYWALNEQIKQLVQQYADGPVQPGVRLRQWPVSAKEEYEKLNQERTSAWNEYLTWGKVSSETVRKIVDSSFDSLKSVLSDWYAK